MWYRNRFYKTKIYLAPDSLTKLSISNLEDFLESKIPYSLKVMEDRVTGSISSPGDTIRNRAYKIITDYFSKEGIQHYVIRRWTEEEMYVTKAKMNNQKYNLDTIQWKETTFPPSPPPLKMP